MVRLKTRYILFQLWYPEAGGGAESSRKGLPSEIPTESTSTLSARTLASTLRLSMTKNFGNEALADTLTSFAVKYFSNKTSTGILRVHRDAVERVVAAMFFVQTLEGRDVIWECVGISGSISKCEKRAIARNRRMIRQLKREGDVSGEAVDGLLLEAFDGRGAGKEGADEEEDA